MPPLDDGRLELSPPKGWNVAPRRRGYVTQFYFDKSRQSRIPRIWVTVEESPFDQPSELTESNVVDFAEEVRQRLERDGVKLIESVRPMIIGTTPCARYVRMTKFRSNERGQRKEVTAERQILETLANGRLYTVDLHVPRGKMLEFRDAGYSVVASMKFLDGGPSETESDDEPSGEPTDGGGSQPTEGGADSEQPEGNEKAGSGD